MGNLLDHCSIITDDGRFSSLLGVGVRPHAVQVSAAGPSAIEFEVSESDAEPVIDPAIYKDDDDDDDDSKYDDILLYSPNSDNDDGGGGGGDDDVVDDGDGIEDGIGNNGRESPEVIVIE